MRCAALVWCEAPRLLRSELTAKLFQCTVHRSSFAEIVFIEFFLFEFDFFSCHNRFRRIAPLRMKKSHGLQK